MNILMVTMSMNIGGAETHILELCRELTAGGDTVTLASFGGVYADEAEAAGVRCVTLPLHTKRPAEVLRSYRGLKTLIEEGNFDLVHAHARIPAFITGLLQDRVVLKDGKKFRFVTTAHLNFSVNPLWRLVARWGERVMAVSDDIADYLVTEYGYPRDRIHTTINGIDTEKFSPDVSPEPVLSSLGLDPGRRRVVYMSRLDADRADPAFRLVEIMPRLAETCPDADLVIVGGGTEFERLKEQAEAANRSVREKTGADRDVIYLTGSVSNTNEYCAAADVFVGVSRSALEAMAAGVPVILAGGQGSLGVFREETTDAAVSTNFCCRGCDMADGESLLRDVTSLLSLSPEERAEMGRRNRAFVEERYTVRRMADDYRAMYKKLLSSPVPFHLSKTPADMVISGYYGFGNLGDESLLDIIAQTAAETIPGVKIAALTRSPGRDSRRTGLCCVNRLNLPRVAREIARAPMLLSGGGSLLQDATSHRSLKYYAGLLSYAEKQGAAAVIYANGIGPIRNEKNRAFAGRVVREASAVSVRDSDSRSELISLGVPARQIRVTADPAFLIPPASPERIRTLKEELGLKGGYFAVSLRPCPRKSKGGRKSELTEDDRQLAGQVAAAMREIWVTWRITPVIVPMQRSQDTPVCALAAAEPKRSGVPSVLYRPASAPELIGFLADARFTVGMRLHAVILASSAGTPVIALSYDPKVDGMMKQLGQPYAVKIPDFTLRENPLLSYDILDCAKQVMDNRDAIAAELSETAARMRNLCREDMLFTRRILKRKKKSE